MENTTEKAYLTTADLMARYGIGINHARKLIQRIKFVSGGGKLGKGKVLLTEVEHWENEIHNK